jgi:hypothetical protein
MSTPNTPSAPLNGAIYIVSNIMRNLMASAAKAEFGGLFYNGQEACPIRQALLDMGHPQPATPTKTDSSTACGIANNTIKQSKSKAMERRFYWIRCRLKQNQFCIHWKQGECWTNMRTRTKRTGGTENPDAFIRLNTECD